jgi:two-component system response regulator MprA
MQTLLVVDDEPRFLRTLATNLRGAGYAVETATTVEGALLAAKNGRIDALVLDLVLPDGSGKDVCVGIREWSEVPIVVVSAVGEEREKVEALDAGADDYVVKPFALAELLARVRALLRRSADEAVDVLHFGDLELDPATREVRRDGNAIELTRTEFALLELLMLNPRQVLTRSVIFERVWGYDFGFGSNSLDVYIGYLRRKTEAGGKPRLIQTIRGVGYALREQ